MLLMAEKAIRGGICHSVYRYANANNKYMKYYDKNKESSYVQYWHVSSVSVWAMSQKILVNNLEWIDDTCQFNEDFIKNYNEEGDEEYFPDVDGEYLKKVHKLYNDLPFSPERMKKKKIEKLLANLQDETEYVIPIRNLNQALNHGLVWKRFHRIIKFK